LNLSDTTEKLIILGDFNSPGIDWDTLSADSSASNCLCDLVFQAGLSQLIDKSTHIHGNILDLLLTNAEEDIHSLQVHSTPLLSSDHYNITFSVTTVNKLSSKPTVHYSFSYSKGDYLGLSNYLLQTDFAPCFLTHEIDNIWHIIEHKLITAMKLFIPINKHHSIQHPPWFTSEIRHIIKRLRTLRRRYKLHPSQNILDTIASLEDTLQSKISSAKLDFESSLISNFASTNNTKIYKHLKSISKSNCMSITVYLDSNDASTELDKAKSFQSLFPLNFW